MVIPGKTIAEALRKELKVEIDKLKKKGVKLTLVDILISDASDQVSFVKIKKALALKLGIGFKFVHLEKTPSFEVFANMLREFSADPVVTGIIIQQPLPFQLQTDSLYNFIPLNKEIEGHKNKTSFSPPLGLAVLTILKYIYKGEKISKSLFVDLEKDAEFFKKNLKNKKVVIIGRGMTGGNPIGQTLNKLKIDYLSIGSSTYDPVQYYKDADIIITAVGQKILSAEMLKPGVILLNVGLRRENDKLKGDYDENEVKNIAGFYTPTPGGIGPIDVIYLYKNLLDSLKVKVKVKGDDRDDRNDSDE